MLTGRIVELEDWLKVEYQNMMQDGDPHHGHTDPNNLYYFLILAPIAVFALIYFGSKLMTYLEHRRNRTGAFREDTSNEDRNP